MQKRTRKFLGLLLSFSVLLSLIPSSVVQAASSIKIGDYVQMGSYYGEPILWRCVDIDENGPLMLTDRILCIKPFDAGSYYNNGSHMRNSGRLSYGSNYWADSNMRSWLNSNAPAGKVKWLCGNPPIESKVWNGYNEYDQEAGFLTNFTLKEINAMKLVTQKSLVSYPESDNGIYDTGNARHEYNYYISSCVQNYDRAYAEYVTDRMFLLDVKQVNKVYQNSTAGKLGNNYYIGKPTQQCVQNSEYKSSSLNANSYWYYWLRSPYANYYSHVRYVDSGGYVIYSSAYRSHFGVRPAFYLNLQSAIFKSGIGWESVPYVISSSSAANIGTSESDVNSQTSQVYEADQQKVLQKLKIDTQNIISNISVGHDKIKGPSITFLGKTFYLFEFDGKLDLNFGNINVQAKVNADKKTVQFLFGYKIFSESANLGDQYNDEGDARWKKSYEQIKSLYKGVTGNKVDNVGLWNKFSALRGDLKEFESDLLVSAKCKVAGYMELSYETGSAKFSEGGFLMEASIGGEFVGRIPAIPVAYCVLGLNSSLEGKIYIAYENYLSINSELNAKITANVGIGIGSKKAKTYIEGGFDGTFGAKMLAMSGTFKTGQVNNDWLTLTISGNVYAKGSLAGFISGEKKWPIGTPVQIYPRNQVSLSSVSLFSEQDIDDILENARPLERDYLKLDDEISLMSVTDSNKIFTAHNVYDYNSPVITRMNNGSYMLLWLDDDGTKNDINKTSLVYSIYENGEWSEKSKVFETGTYNDAAEIYCDGENVHIVWAKAKTEFAASASLNDIITDTELYYTKYDGSTFSEPIQLTDNNKMELAYYLYGENGKIAVAWVENSENDPYMTSGSNTVKYRELSQNVWQNAKTAVVSQQAIVDITPFYSNNTFNCAYCTGEDQNDMNVYIGNEFIDNGSYVNYYDGNIYYLKDSSVIRYNTQAREAKTLDVSGITNFSIVDGDIYALVSNGFKCELYKSEKENENYQSFKQITDFGKYIRNYSVVKDSSGNDIYALNLVEVTDGEKVYGNSELCVCTEAEINDLAISAVYYDYEDVEPGRVLTVNAEIVNLGNSDSSNFNVEIKDKGGNEVYKKTVTESISAGDSVIIPLYLTLPTGLSMSAYSVNIVSDSDNDSDNNVRELLVGYGDARVDELEITKKQGGATLSGKLSNTGYSKVNSVTLKLYDPSNPDVILDTKYIGSVSASQNKEFTFEIPKEYLVLEDKLTMHGLSVEAETGSEEADYENNTSKIVFGELTDCTVTLVDGNELIDIIAYYDFNDYVYRKDGYVLEGWYTEDGEKITSVDDDISENLVLFARFDESDKDISYRFKNVRYENGKILSDVYFDFAKIPCDVTVAVYDSNKLIGVSSKSVTSEDAILSFEALNISAKENYTVKLFCWDSLETMIPIGEILEKTIYQQNRIVTNVTLESRHDYLGNTDEIKEYTYEDECQSIEVTFTEDTETESNYDFIYIYDSQDNEIGKYSGTELSGKTLTVIGNTVKIRLTSDKSVNKYGYKTESIIVNR